jgi:hypothetical protein
MILLKSLFLGVVVFAFGVNHASAQYINHLQKYYSDVIERHNNSIFDTKALTPVDEGDELQWAFASTISSELKIFETGRLNTMLTKLKPNVPVTDPFAVEWIAEFSDYAGFDGDPYPFSVDVEDVYYIKGNRRSSGYILCGRILQPKSNGSTKSYGFLLRLDRNGHFLRAKYYKKVSVFKSVVETNKRGKGFVAVGMSQFPEDPTAQWGTVRDAIYVQVKEDLKPKCAFETEGIFFGMPPPPDSDGVDSTWNKVIQYNVQGGNFISRGSGYAIVGDTHFNPTGFARRDRDVIVGVVGEKCKPRWIKQYGGQLLTDTRWFETGNSIAQFHKRKGGLVITGNTNNKPPGAGPSTVDDVLVFRVDSVGDLEWMRHFNVRPDPVCYNDCFRCTLSLTHFKFILTIN